MSNLKIIRADDTSKVNDLIEYLSKQDFIAFDTETTGLTQHDGIVGMSFCSSIELAYYLILSEWDTTSNTLNRLSCSSLDILLKTLATKDLVMHNGVFDCTMVYSNYKVSLIESLHTDTMLLAHIINENQRVGLKELGAAFFGGKEAVKEAEAMKASVIKNGGIYTAATKEFYKADSTLLAEYGAKDALLTYKLFLALVPELYKQNLNSFFYEEESMPLLKGPTYHLNTSGLKVDAIMLESLKKQLIAECESAKAFVNSEIKARISRDYPATNKKNTFNISSPSQLSWLLFEVYKLQFGTLTKEGKNLCRSLGKKLPYTNAARSDFMITCKERLGQVYQEKCISSNKIVRAKKIKEPWKYVSCDKSLLNKYKDKYAWIARLLEYQKKTKLLNTYVEGIQNRMSYGTIYPSFLQHGTTSGRYSSRNPNFQNLPREDKRVKQCIVARPGKVFVGADYSQLEPRIFAYYSGDERLLKSFQTEDDFYSVIGMEVYDKFDCVPRKEGPDSFGEKYKNLRNLSKVIALASTYGATAHQLAPTTGKSIDDTQEDINSYFEKFPDVKKMMIEAHTLVREHGYVSSLFGRKRRLPEALNIPKKVPHHDLPYEARNILNLAVNHRIQSTGASIINRSTISFLKECDKNGLKCQIVCQVHDSVVVECDEQDASNILKLLQNCLENTVDLKTIKLEAIPKIGKNLSEV